MFAGRIRTMLLQRHNLTFLGAGSLPDGALIGKLHPADIGLLSEINPEVEPMLETSKLSAGHICYLAMVDGRPAHYSWVQSSGVHSVAGSGRKRQVLPGEFWIYACFTAASARGRRIYPATLRRILADYKNKGFHTAWIYVSDENTASQNGIARAGFQLDSQLHSLCIRSTTIPLPEMLFLGRTISSARN